MDETLKRLIEEAAFRETRKGYDRGEVDDFLDRAAAMAGKVEKQLAQAIERGRAAEAQLKRVEAEREVLRAGAAEAGPGAVAPRPAPAPIAAEGATEEVARTLVLAQRTADAAIAEARQEAERLLDEAQEHAEAARAAADAEASSLRDQVTTETQRQRQEARESVAAEVRALTEAREALREDMELLEQHVEARQSQLQGVLEEMQRLLDDLASGRLDVTPLPVDDYEAYDEYDDGADEGIDEGGAGPGEAGDPEGEATDHEPEAADVPADGGRDASEPSGAAARPSTEPVMAAAPTAPEAEPSASTEGWHDSPSDAGASPAPRVVISEIDHEAPVARRDVDPGPPTQQISAAELDLGGSPARGAGAEEDEFLAELRKAIHDDEPLGPSQPHEAPTSEPHDHLFDPDDRRGRGRGNRFGRRR